jgi:MerR family transcriptional regulator, copper efflux regulator
MRITEAAQTLGTSARMLRYRESLGLLPPVRQHRAFRRLTPRRGPEAARPAPGRPGAATPRAAGTVPAKARSGQGPGHRQFSEADLAAAALGLSIERRHDISPAALAFGIRVLADPRVRSEVAELGRRIGRIPAPAAQALDFEQERALRLLRLDERRADPRRASRRRS